jgi:hypothetical protein
MATRDHHDWVLRVFGRQGVQITSQKFFSVDAAAKFSIFAFFLLITDQALVIAAFKFGVPIRPVFFYLVIAAVLLVTAVLQSGFCHLVSDPFFLPFTAIVAVGALMYRGEAIGPDFGAMVSEQFPSSLGYAIWPALNLAASAGLNLLARHERFRAPLVMASFAALVLQVATMEADMWWPAIFGDPGSRAGGLARNANTAALVVSVLAALLLETRLAPYAAVLAAFGVLLSQSRAGVLTALVLTGCLLFSESRRLVSRPSILFGVAVAFVLAMTIDLSPVLNPSPLLNPLPQAVASPLTLEDRVQERASSDASVRQRWSALIFFSRIVIEHPFGFGTGFTNRFAIGPHNSFLKLAVDNGVISAIGLLLLLVAVSWRAFETRSPAVTALALIAWLNAMFYHTFMVDPITLPIMATAIGLSASSPRMFQKQRPPGEYLWRARSDL